MINFTLLIQIINFYITYRVLKKVIFKPTIDNIEKREHEKRELNLNINKQEAFILAKEKIKKSNLLDFQKKIQQNFILPPNKLPDIPQEISYKRNLSEIKSLTTRIKDLIIQEVPRVR